jgi:type II secretion system protein N
MAIKLPHLPLDRLGPRTRRVLRYAGYALFAIVVFVFALQATFPYERVKDKLIEAMYEKYEVTVGAVERGWMPGRVYFKAFSIRTRQTTPGESVTTVYIDKLEVDLGVLALLGRAIDVDVEAKLGRGKLAGNVRLEKLGKGNIKASFEGDDLPADALPMRALIGLPMTGRIELDLDIALPMEKSKMGKTAINWQKARGGLSLSCPGGCTFGDGKTLLKPLLKNTRNQAMVGEGIDFGKVSLDTLVAKVTIKSGMLTLDKFDAASKDGTLKVDYTMTLEKEFGDSMVAGCLRFKGSDDLIRREPKTHAAISTTGAELRSDGLFHIRLTDRFKDMKRLNQECGPGTNTNTGEDFSARPQLTIQSDDVRPPAITPPQPAPTPAPEPPPEPPPAVPPGMQPQDGAGAGTPMPGAPPGGPAGPAAPGGPANELQDRDPERAGDPNNAGSAVGTGEQPQPTPAVPPAEQ